MIKKILICGLMTLSLTGLVANGQKESAAKSNLDIDLSIKEAPMFSEMVSKGELPPLAERLPVEGDTMVEPDVMSLGQFGGAMAFRSNNNGKWHWGPLTEQSMFRFKQDMSGQVEPNVCKAFYSNEDATVWTIEMREGMKWSDGVDFTADDVMFYYDHISTPALNPDGSPLPVDSPQYYNSFTSKPYKAYQVELGGKTYWADFEKVNDYKFTVTFKAPKPDFPEAVAIDNKWMFLPKHVYKNIVSRKDGVKNDADFPYITEAQAIENANKLVGKDFTSYTTMGKKVAYYNWIYASIPQLRSFIAVKDNWDKVGETYKLVRNPYFWKTDSEGRQLPYLDSLDIKIINEEEQYILKAMAGEVDIYEATFAKDLTVVGPAIADTFHPGTWGDVLWGGKFALNQTVKDLDKRALFQNLEFRHALSISMDRNFMNEALMDGLSEPRQCSVTKAFPQYDAEWEKKWTEYDPDHANKILDTLTEPWDRSKGTFRTMKGTNKELEIIVLVTEQVQDGIVSIHKKYFGDIGIKISTKVTANSAKLILANEHEASFADIGAISPSLRADYIVPNRNYKEWYGAFGKWYEDGKSTKNGGVEPTGDVRKLIDAYDTIRSASGPSRNAVIEKQTKIIYDLHKKNIWVIGWLKPIPKPKMISNKLVNFPSNLVNADEFRSLNLARPEQFYKIK